MSEAARDRITVQRSYLVRVIETWQVDTPAQYDPTSREFADDRYLDEGDFDRYVLDNGRLVKDMTECVDDDRFDIEIVHPETESAPEWFHFGLDRYDVAAAKRILTEHGPGSVLVLQPQQMAGTLTWIGIDPDAAAALSDEALDVPLIGYPRERGNFMLIDGHHRLHAALQRGKETLTVHILPTDHAAEVGPHSLGTQA